MQLLSKRLQQVTLEDLQGLVDDQVPESPVLDYKEDLPGGKEGDRKEFLADVSSFANASGGVIIYGVQEKRDEQNRKTGVPEALVGLSGTIAADAQQRLEQILRSGFDPALGGFAIRTFPLGGEGARFVIALGVSPSLLAPHAVAFATTLPIWRRVGMSKAPLSMAELRQMFSERDAWEQEAEAFRAGRLELHSTIDAGRVLSNLSGGPALLLQVLPLGRLRRWIDLRQAHDHLAALFRFGGSSFNERYTFDGIVRTGVKDNPLTRYVQWFRFGGVEVFSATFGTQSRSGQQPAVDIVPLTFYAVEYTHAALTALDEILALRPPYAVFLNTVNVQGRVFELPDTMRPRFPQELPYRPISERHLLPPPALFEERPGDVDATVAGLRMVLDALWQAGGLAHCWMIGPDGRWKGRDLHGWREVL